MLDQKITAVGSPCMVCPAFSEVLQFSGYIHLLLNVPVVLLPEPVKAQVSAKSPKDIFSALAQVEQVGT